MRRIVVPAVAAAMIFLSAISSFAAFNSVSVATITACVVFTGASETNASIELRNLSDDNTTSWIYWDAANINLGVTSWHRADSYIVLYSTITQATGGVQIYTDNKSTDAIAIGYTGTGNPAGLYSTDGPTEDPLPICWRAVDASTNTLTIKQGSTGLPDRLWSQELGDSYPCFIWIKDRNTSTFVDGESYVTIKSKSDGGLQHAEATWSPTASPDYIYIGANFINANTPRTYRATIRIETFTE